MLSANRVEINQVSEIDIITDEYGFLINPLQWTTAFAENVLELSAGELTPRHIAVMEYVRKKSLHLDAIPPVRNVCKCTGLEKSELKVMFGSCLQLWRASGLTRPDDEIRAHMN